jgi:hypothetical protein
MLRKQFEQNNISSQQAEADADSLITSTALTLAKSEQRPIVVIGNDTDLLDILVSQVTQDMRQYIVARIHRLYMISRPYSRQLDMSRHI